MESSCWRYVVWCVLHPPHRRLVNSRVQRRWNSAGISKVGLKTKNGVLQKLNEVSVDVVPSFRISKFEHVANPPADAGMWDNACWPSVKAANDPGFALFSWDPWYKAHKHEYDFTKEYEKGINGA